MRAACERCGYLSIFAHHCLYCRIELSGNHVAATLGPPIDGFYHIGHMPKEFQPRHSSRRRGTYHMTFMDRIALGQAQGAHSSIMAKE